MFDNFFISYTAFLLSHVAPFYRTPSQKSSLQEFVDNSIDRVQVQLLFACRALAIRSLRELGGAVAAKYILTGLAFLRVVDKTQADRAHEL